MLLCCLANSGKPNKTNLMEYFRLTVRFYRLSTNKKLREFINITKGATVKITIQKFATYLFLSFFYLILPNVSYAWGLDDLKDLGKQLENVDDDIKKVTGNSKEKEPVTPVQETSQPSTAPEQAQPEKSAQSQGSSNFNFPWESISMDMKPEELEQLLLDWGYKRGEDCKSKIVSEGKFIRCTYEGKWQGKWPSAINIFNRPKGPPDQIHVLSFTLLSPDSLANGIIDHFVRLSSKDGRECKSTREHYLTCFLVKDVELSSSRGIDHFQSYHVNFPYNPPPGWAVIDYKWTPMMDVVGWNPNKPFVERFARSVQ